MNRLERSDATAAATPRRSPLHASALTLRALFVLGAVLCAFSTANGQVPPPGSGTWQVTITDLELLPGGTYASAYAINDTGKIVGMANDASGALKTVQWVDGHISIIPGLSPSAASVPADLNDAGEIAGTLKVGYPDSGIYWNPANQTFQLDGLPGEIGSSVQANGMNASGHIVGLAQEGPPNLWGHAVVWLADSFQTDLGFMGGGHYSEAYGINDLGAVVGVASVANTNQHAFLWQGGSFTDLSTWSGGGAASIAYAINNHGAIVGLNSSVASIWSGGAVHPLPMPPGISAFTPALDINDAGDIIATGSKGFPNEVGVLWRNGEPIDLGTLPGGAISRARRINAAGDIVGEAKAANGFFHAVRWTVQHSQWTDIGNGLAGTSGVPHLAGSGNLTAGSVLHLDLAGAEPAAAAWLVVGLGQVNLPFAGGVLVPNPNVVVPTATSAFGTLNVSGAIPQALPAGLTVTAQVWVQDSGGPAGLAASNAAAATAP